MKLLIVFCSLFVQLAFAGIFPIFGPKPIYKAIFDKGHLITNSVSVRELDVEQVGDVLLFRFHHDQTYSPTKFDYMAIRLDENGWSNHTFVIESKPKPKYDKVPESSARFCAWDHSGWERKLIKDCHGSMSIRFELNEEEQAKVEESRKALSDMARFEPNLSDKELKFKVINNKEKLTTESTDLQQLKVVKQQNSVEVKALLDQWNSGYISLENKMDEKNSLKKGQFVVQSVQIKREKCYEESLGELVHFCTGQVILREMREDEKIKY